MFKKQTRRQNNKLHQEIQEGLLERDQPCRFDEEYGSDDFEDNWEDDWLNMLFADHNAEQEIEQEIKEERMEKEAEDERILSEGWDDLWYEDSWEDAFGNKQYPIEDVQKARQHINQHK